MRLQATPGSERPPTFRAHEGFGRLDCDGFFVFHVSIIPLFAVKIKAIDALTLEKIENDVEWKEMTMKITNEDGEIRGEKEKIHGIEKSLRYAVMVPTEDQLVQITPKLRAMLRTESLDLKDFILYLEIVTEIKNKIDGLLAYDNKAIIPLRKNKIQILLPEDIIQIPLDKLFPEKGREGAYHGCRREIIRDLSAAGCFNNSEFLSQATEEITLTRSSINEQNFRPLYDTLVAAYRKSAEKIKQLAEGTEKPEYGSVEEPANYFRKNIHGIAEKTLESIYLIGDSMVPSQTISMVLNEDYKHPERFAVLNNEGKEAVMKKLYDIVYCYQFNTSDKRVLAYDKELAKGLNNDVFKRPKISGYIKSNHLKKPTLVAKSSDGRFILAGDTIVKIIRPNEIQSQFRSLYPQKTR